MSSRTHAFAARTAVSLALVVVPLAGCPRREAGDDRTYVEAGTADEWTLATHPALPVAANELRDLFRRVLEQGSRFAPAEAASSAPAGRLRVRIVNAESRVDPDGSGTATVQVKAQLEFRPPLAGDDEVLAVVAAGNARGPMPGAARAAAADALARGVVALDEAVRVRGRPSLDLVADLASPDPERAWAALVQLAERRDPAAFEPLVAALREGDEDRALEALALLVTLDDRRAARPIINAAEVRGGALLVEAVASLGSLGGEDAEAYLFTLSEGHVDARVRGRAREALELARRRSESARRTASRTEGG